MRKHLAIAEASGYGDSDRKSFVLRKIRYGTILIHLLLFTPAVLFWLTILASVERTPLTGRWRLILLSPEEEEEIALQLAGPGWYQAVGEILAKDGSRNTLPPTDWRTQWVQDTLRRLEGVIPMLQHEQELGSKWLECGPDDIPFPPPADYPLRPRPRASEYIRRFAEVSCARTPHRSPHVIPGPPYSLMVVDNPEASNAFSYGFGPDGGGGIVVFSGFLDDVLSKGGAVASTMEEMQFSHPSDPAQSQSTSWYSALFGGIFPSQPAVPAPPHPIPTEEQTSELAILLAHELSHLILSHHLETLSSTSVVWPGIVSIVTDVVRAMLFPVTMMFGPFLNDAVAGVGKSASWDLQTMAEYCTSQHQEIEADVVSARLLAHAGFDPRHALRFWEERGETEQTAECTPGKAKAKAASDLRLRWMGSAHPLNQVRVGKLREEFERWEKERAKARKRLLQESSRAS
ncbi:hypothetical protein EIP91_007896 [Steccherinum ochraceum]|uniref:Peptidase M48 domain-containing protein n=1 Tax=Steccherinum ochraceum TaxID=92696 RepID=A0A4R0RKU5_9APHY|nr:hypothetical protein EIP91_007896 [Steccherinum ochraceum]